MSDEISIAMRALMQRLQPLQIILPVSGDDRVFAGERRIADDRVEAATLPCKDLRELRRPMEGRDGMHAVADFRCEGRDGADPRAGAEMGLDSLLEFDQAL